VIRFHSNLDLSIVFDFFNIFVFQAPYNQMACGIAGDAQALQYFRTETDNTNRRCLVFMKRSPAVDRNINNFAVSWFQTFQTFVNGQVNYVDFTMLYNKILY